MGLRVSVCTFPLTRLDTNKPRRSLWPRMVGMLSRCAAACAGQASIGLTRFCAHT